MRKMEHYLHFPLALIVIIALFTKLTRAETVTQSFSTSSSSSSNSANGGPAQNTFQSQTSWNDNGKKGGDKVKFAWEEGKKGGPPKGMKMPSMPKFNFPKMPPMPKMIFPKFAGFPGPSFDNDPFPGFPGPSFHHDAFPGFPELPGFPGAPKKDNKKKG